MSSQTVDFLSHSERVSDQTRKILKKTQSADRRIELVDLRFSPNSIFDLISIWLAPQGF